MDNQNGKQISKNPTHRASPAALPCALPVEPFVATISSTLHQVADAFQRRCNEEAEPLRERIRGLLEKTQTDTATASLQEVSDEMCNNEKEWAEKIVKAFQDTDAITDTLRKKILTSANQLPKTGAQNDKEMGGTN